MNDTKINNEITSFVYEDFKALYIKNAMVRRAMRELHEESTNDRKIVEEKKKEKKDKKAVECPICVGKSVAMIKCPKCEYEVCRGCVQHFLIELDDVHPRCMEPSCGARWSPEFLSKTTHSKFHSKNYRNRQASLILERERSLLPTTQPLVAEKQRLAKVTAEINHKYSEIFEYKQQIVELRKNIETIRDEIYILRSEHFEHDNKEKKMSYTFRCPSENCKGYVDDNMKCPICNKNACNKCHVSLDEADMKHECDKEVVATISFLKKDTKSCPSCRTPIHKVEGCDQMYCTVCRTAFSWRSGKIETGVIHNPHFFEIQRNANNGVVARNPLDVVCGGLPNYNEVLMRMRSFGDDSLEWFPMESVYQVVTHIQEVELPKYITGEIDLTDLRVKYLMNELDEKKWISEIKKRYKQQEKNEEYKNILATFRDNVIILLNNFLVTREAAHLEDIFALRIYVNKLFINASKRFKNAAPGIHHNWFFTTNIIALIYSSPDIPEEPDRLIYRNPYNRMYHINENFVRNLKMTLQLRQINEPALVFY